MARGDDSSSAMPMQERPASIAPSVSVSGFKLPMPSPNSSPAIAQKGPEEKDAGAADQSNVEGQGQDAIPPSSAGGMSQQSGSVMDERDSGMFTFNRPGSRGGSDSRAYTSSYYAGGSRMNTGIGISYGSPSTDAHGRPHTGRPLTAFTIPEEFAYAAEPEVLSPAAAVAAAYREGRPPPPTRGNLATPVIELDERMRTAATMETAMGSEGTSTPNQGSMKTEDIDGYSKVNPIEDMLDGVDPEDLMKLGAEADYAQGIDPNGVFEEEEDSPFPEVRASVSNYDDPDMPCLTFRAMLLGTFFAMAGAALNTYFQIRYPSPFVTPIVIQVITYPLGAGMARFFTARIFSSPKWLQRTGFPAEWSLNPGPFNIKEHSVIVIMANVGIAPAFGINVLLAFDKFYGIKTGFGFDILLLLSTQMVGFTFAGLTRRFLIWPASLIWPQSLVTCTLLNTFHAEDDDGTDGSLPRHRFFIYVFLAAGCWYFLPGFLFVGLSAFSWVCWIAPTNPVVNQLFGVATGLGMSSITFDWSQIAYIGSPLIVPWWAIVNVFIGFVALYWVFSPAMYYSNTWDMAYLPISVNAIFDRFGAPYNTSVILTPNIQLDQAAYEAYSPLYFPTTYVTIYFLAFALASASIVHTAIYHGATMWKTVKDIKKAQTDIHAKLMLVYKEAPTWWYFLTFLGCLGMAIGLVKSHDTGLPVWGLFLAIIIVGLYILPGGFIFAVSTQLITVNILAESIPGVLFLGKPVANMIFKCYSVQALNASLYFIQDLKLGHYMKVPPRTTFAVQIVASVLAAFAQAGVKEGLLKAVPDLCSDAQPARLICPTAKSVYNASIIWGLVGPNRIFGEGSPYRIILWSLLVGAVLPFPAWLLAKRLKRKTWLDFVNFPVMLTGASFIPPATGINYSSWFLAAFVFQYLMRRFHFRWWSKYNFVTSAALDSGTAISAIIIFLVLQLPKSGALRPRWWGNTVYTKTYDWLGYPYMIPPEEGFGRAEWH